MAKKVTKEMTLGEIVSNNPEAEAVMLKYGLHCIGCHVAAWETLEQGAKGHGLSEEQVDKMVEEINKAVEEKKE